MSIEFQTKVKNKIGDIHTGLLGFTGDISVMLSPCSDSAWSFHPIYNRNMYINKIK